jgi:cell division protein FtsB
MKPAAEDYIAALEAQRNSALNELVNLRAETMVLRREIERLHQDRTAIENGEAHRPENHADGPK